MLEEQRKIDKKLLSSVERPVALHKLATYVIKYGKLQRAGEPAARLPAERVLRERPIRYRTVRFVLLGALTVAGTRNDITLYSHFLSFSFLIFLKLDNFSRI